MNKSRMIYLVVLAAGLLIFSYYNKPGNKADYTFYKNTSELLLEELAGKARPKVVVSQAKALIESGSRLIAEIVKQKPHCGEVLNAIVRDKDKMIELSHEEIEHQYHQGAALPKLADPMKQQECYEYKELIVHPATVVVLSKANDWSENAKIDMQAEIDEVLAHYENISFLMGDADQAQAR